LVVQLSEFAFEVGAHMSLVFSALAMPPKKHGTCLFFVAFRRSYHHEVYEFMDRRRFQSLLIPAKLENCLLLLGRKAPREVALELLDEHRHAFAPPALVTDRVLNQHFRQLPAVLELHG